RFGAALPLLSRRAGKADGGPHQRWHRLDFPLGCRLRVVVPWFAFIRRKERFHEIDQSSRLEWFRNVRSRTAILRDLFIEGIEGANQQYDRHVAEPFMVSNVRAYFVTIFAGHIDIGQNDTGLRMQLLELFDGRFAIACLGDSKVRPGKGLSDKAANRGTVVS